MKHHMLVAFCFFTLLTLVMTFPLAIKFTSAIPDGGRDSYLVMGQIERKSAIISDNGWVEGGKMIIKEREFNSYLPYIVADQIFHNKFTTNNSLFLLSFVLSGWGMYLLALYVTNNKLGAYIAGMIFAFSSFHVYQATAIHLGMRHQELLPFFALFLLRFFEKFELKYFAGIAVFAAAIAITEHQLLAFTVLFAVFFIVYKIFANPQLLFNKKLWLFFVIALLFLVGAAFTLFGNLLKESLSRDNSLNPGLKSVVNLSVIPADIFLPPVFHSLWPTANGFIKKYVFGISRSGDSYYAGISIIIFLLYFLYNIYFKKSRKDSEEVKSGLNKNWVKFWLVEVIVFFVLAMGPQMKIGGMKIFLPYYLIYQYVPFYNNIRVVGRIFVFVVMGLSILVACGTAYFIEKYPLKKKKIVIFLAAVILLDFWIAPMKTDALAYSSFYDRIAKDPPAYKLLEIPGSTNDVFFNYEWITRSVHQKELINGMPVAREVEGQFDFQKNTPVIKELLYTIPRGKNPEKHVGDPAEYYQNATTILNQNNVGYITISKQYTSSDVLANAEQFIEKYIRYDNKYEDQYIVAYKVSAAPAQ